MVSVADHHHHHRRVDDEEVFDHPHNLVLLPVGRAGGADEFGGLSEKSARTRGGNLTRRLTAAHHGSRIGCLARLDRSGGRFAGEGGLVHEQ